MSAPPSFATLLLRVDGPHATLVMNRPDRLNALTPTMARELLAALTYLSGLADVHVVTLTGAGRGFGAGADVDAFRAGDFFRDPLRAEEFRSVVLLHEMPQVTLAAVNGGCAGASMALALACDLRVASSAAVFNTAFLDMGASGDMAGAWTLPRIVGAAKARELYFLPERLDADEAARIGLVSRVFDPSTFDRDVELLAARLAGYTPAAVRGMKRNFLDAERMRFADYVRHESAGVLAGMTSASTVDGFRDATIGRTGPAR